MLAQTNIAPVKSAILIIYGWFNYLVISYLFSDAEMWKNILKDVFRRDFAGDGAEVVNGKADIFAQQVGGNVVLQGSDGRSEGVTRLMQSVIVATVGDDDIALVCRRGVRCRAQNCE